MKEQEKVDGLLNVCERFGFGRVDTYADPALVGLYISSGMPSLHRWLPISNRIAEASVTGNWLAEMCLYYQGTGEMFGIEVRHIHKTSYSRIPEWVHVKSPSTYNFYTQVKVPLSLDLERLERCVVKGKRGRKR